MPTIFPGAIWRPMPGQEKRAKRRKGRGVGFHVAVYGGPSIYDINVRTGNDAHLYVRYDGVVEQNVDLDLQAWAGAAGNGSMIWVETAGGTNAKTVNTELWTPAQVATLARIARWAHDTEGVPLQVMPDSKPASRGIGTHRLGIQHSRGIGAVPGWLIAGGEKWSSVLGKECPGNAKIAQLPAIISVAQNGGTTLEDDMPLTDDEVNRIAAAVVNRQVSGTRELWQVLASLDSRDPNTNPVAQAVVDRQVVGDKTLWQVLAGEDAEKPQDPAALAAALQPVLTEAARTAAAEAKSAGASADADEIAARVVARMGASLTGEQQ